MDDIQRLDGFLDAHDGVITASEAARLGLGAPDLRRLTRSGSLRRVIRGAYLRPDPDPAVEDRCAVVAVLRSQPGRFAASHQSAALLLGLPVPAGDLRRVHVTRRTGTAATRSHETFTVHRCPGVPDAFGSVSGQAVVAPALAVVGTALEAGVRAGIGVADAALRLGLASREEMGAWLGRMRHTPGVTAARFVVDRASPTAESAAESRARLELLALGYRVVPQFTVLDEGGRFVARVDFLLPDLGVVVEVDGQVKYAGAQGRQALVREKRREDAIRALGYGVTRLVWADLARPERVRALVEQARLGVRRSAERIAAEVRQHAQRTGATWDGQVLHPCAPVALVS